ncbi:hypothetical protein GCM10027079_21590 [Sediminivirga luteola]|uniref:Uncharacterized protein n=1 Tax=Sediminivirga luteola TaxID=1774748 RepID=A0A8J2TW99_9MICO|nr:hypothetical protein GCM10011333_08010 [Sediminivirga luteola]
MRDMLREPRPGSRYGCRISAVAGPAAPDRHGAAAVRESRRRTLPLRCPVRLAAVSGAVRVRLSQPGGTRAGVTRPGALSARPVGHIECEQRLPRAHVNIAVAVS